MLLELKNLKRRRDYFTHGVLSQMLRNLQDEPRLPSLHVQGVQDLGEALVELRIEVNVLEGGHFKKFQFN